MKPRNLKTLVGLTCLTVPMSLFAHTGHAVPTGFAHPLSGLDHMIAALAVGLWATQMSKDSLWKLPGTFLSFMILGILFGVLGGVLPGVSMVVPLSVLVLGMMILVSRKLNMNLALGMTACFALFHGLSHGAELAHVQGIWVSATGLLATTALLHGAGVGLGSIAEKARHIELLKPAGAAIAITGLLMLVL